MICLKITMKRKYSNRTNGIKKQTTSEKNQPKVIEHFKETITLQ
jgi:hypothetical protein